MSASVDQVPVRDCEERKEIRNDRRVVRGAHQGEGKGAEEKDVRMK